MQSYRAITHNFACQIKLVMTDVDGTLTTYGQPISNLVFDAINRLQKVGISIGLVSGRNINNLESLADKLGINGPIIAENGGTAKIKTHYPYLDFGYSKLPAINALTKLKILFPNNIKEKDDNDVRIADVAFWLSGMSKEDLRSSLDDVELLDSGYLLHLMQKGISKGKTLARLLDQTELRDISPSEILVIGDSTTDLSLFELFQNSILITNPLLPYSDSKRLHGIAKYISEHADGEGFIEVATHIAKLRSS